MDSYELNRRNWDERADIHAASADYELDKFRADPAHLSDVVEFDRPRLGEIAGQKGVHLQCHIGTDTLSLHRLGAQMTGLDFSPKSLDVARGLALATASDIDFVQAEVYAAARVLPAEEFDFVYTGIGALCWLPDVRQWAQVVQALLKPGGRLFIREGHPVLWSLDYESTDQLIIDYPYFETSAPLEEAEEQTYVATDRLLVNATTHTWNHGLAEVVTAVLDAGLTLTGLVEHDSVPWEPLPGQMVKRDGEWFLAKRPERLPLTYTLQAVKA